MFGTFRFLLASFVVLNHAGVTYGGINPGPIAVVSFYIISGYVIGFLIDNRIHGQIFKTFYAERFFRIYPQFVFHLLLSIMLLHLTGHVTGMTATRPNIQSIVINLTLLPLQMKAFSEYLYSLLYVPTSWSLSLEMSFYLIAPFILRSRILDFIAWLSFAIFLLAVLEKIPPNPHTFSYATIFGTLHFFIAGVWLQRYQLRKVKLWMGALVVTGALITIFSSWRSPHVEEVIVGGIGGMLILIFLANVKHQKLKVIDDFLGRISYPVFLNHFLFIWGFEAIKWEVNTIANQSIILVCSWLLGCLAFFLVERPLDKYRRGLRVSMR